MNEQEQKVLQAFMDLVAAYARLRRIVAQPSNAEFCTPFWTPGPPPFRIHDFEMLEVLKKQDPAWTIEQVNNACLALMTSGTFKLVNSPILCPKQDGHLFEMPERKEPVQETPDFIAVRQAVKSVQKNKLFLDWDIYNWLDRAGKQMLIQRINGICYSYVMQGFFAPYGWQWFNPGNDGYTYQIVKEFEHGRA